MTVAVFTDDGITVSALLNTSNHKLMSRGRARRHQRQAPPSSSQPQQDSSARGAAGRDHGPGKAIRALLRQPLLQSGKPSLVLFEKGGVHHLGVEIHT